MIFSLLFFIKDLSHLVFKQQMSKNMGIIDYLKSLFDDNGYFVIRDASFGVAGAIISGCFLKRYISVHSPMNGAIYMLAQTITKHVVNRLIGGEKDIQKSDLLRNIVSVTSGLVVAQKVVVPHVGKWTFISSSTISSLAKSLILGNDR